jgi:peroxiredoxin
MHRQLLFYTLTAGVVILNLLVLTYLFRKYDVQPLRNPPPPSEGHHVHLQAGQSMPIFSAKNLDGDVADSRGFLGKWVLAFYFDSRIDPGFLTYAQTLYEKYDDLDFQPLAISSNASKELGKVIADEGITYPVLIDSKNNIRTLFHLEHHGYGLFLIDPSGSIQFSASQLMPRDSLRQLVERYVVERIDYEPHGSLIELQAGDDIPAYRIREVRSGAELTLKDLDLLGASLIFFRADCSSCRLSSYLKAVEQVSSTHVRDEKVYLIFSRGFSSHDLAKTLTAKSIGSAVYIAKEELKALGAAYATKSSFGEEAIAITTDKRGQINAIHPLTEWLAGLSTGGKQ